ncbi:MAG: carbon-nitrogen hydrolase family protein [bacterium]
MINYEFLTVCLLATCIFNCAFATTPNDWKTDNLIPNGDFSRGKVGGLPDGWEVVIPNKAIAPTFKLIKSSSGKMQLMAQGNGRKECFGYIRCPITPMLSSTDRAFRLRVRLRYEGMTDLNRNLVHMVMADMYNNGIFMYRKEGGYLVGDNRFRGCGHELETAEIRIYFRFSPHGKVWWDEISLQECDPIPPRLVKIATVWGGNSLEGCAKWLDLAGQKGADICLLPEFFDGKNNKNADTINGPGPSLLSAKAKQWKMYTSGTFIEKRGDICLNSAPLYDRNGKLVGIQSKNNLFDPEEDDGTTPGTGYEVFNTDFGKVGIMICYESWFPETARLLAYKGAELVLFPNAGFYRSLMPARAADNGVWLAVSSLGGQGGVWDSSGASGGDKEPDPSRASPTSIISYEVDETNKMVIATVDLSRQYSPHYWGGPMLCAPAARRLRQTLIQSIEDEIAREAHRFIEK